MADEKDTSVLPLKIPEGMSMEEAVRLVRASMGDDANKAYGVSELVISFERHLASFLSQLECLPDLIGVAKHPNLPAQVDEAHQLPLDHMPIIIPSVFPLVPAPDHQGLRPEDRAILQRADMDEDDIEEYHRQLTKLLPTSPLIYAFLMPDGFEEMNFPVVYTNKKINRPEPVVVAGTCLPAGMQRIEQIVFLLPRLLERMAEILLANPRTAENIAARKGKPYPIMEYGIFEEKSMRGEIQMIYLRQSTQPYCARANITIHTAGRTVNTIATKTIPTPKEEEKS
jgi:hypothetical protein